MNSTTNLRDMSSQELYVLGVSDIAYVKKVTEKGASAFAMFAADGTPLGVTTTRELAFAALKQHELEPVSVH